MNERNWAMFDIKFVYVYFIALNDYDIMLKLLFFLYITLYYYDTVAIIKQKCNTLTIN